MLFMIGVEKPKNENEAFGIIVPVFEKLGYGCFAAADNKKDILKNAKAAIIDMVEELISDGHQLSALGEDYVNYQEQYPDFTEWLAIDVPVDELKPRQKRINITLAEPLLMRIDNFVKNHHEYKDRSDFLALAADKQMREMRG